MDKTIFLLRYETKLPGMKRPLRPVPVFKQRPGESEKRFLNRVEVTCKVGRGKAAALKKRSLILSAFFLQGVLKRRQYEDRYNVELVDDPETMVTSVKDREKDEASEMLYRK